jgi:hypothetical protein
MGKPFLYYNPGKLKFNQVFPSCTLTCEVNSSKDDSALAACFPWVFSQTIHINLLPFNKIIPYFPKYTKALA